MQKQADVYKHPGESIFFHSLKWSLNSLCIHTHHHENVGVNSLNSINADKKVISPANAARNAAINNSFNRAADPAL